MYCVVQAVLYCTVLCCAGCTVLYCTVYCTVLCRLDSAARSGRERRRRDRVRLVGSRSPGGRRHGHGLQPATPRGLGRNKDKLSVQPADISISLLCKVVTRCLSVCRSSHLLSAPYQGRSSPGRGHHRRPQRQPPPLRGREGIPGGGPAPAWCWG